MTPSIKVLMLPKDTNHYGTIFGGVILSYIDLAAIVEARKVADRKYVTKFMDSIEFFAPVRVGDVVEFHTEMMHLGRTSISIIVKVYVGITRVTTAEVVLVAIDEAGRPTPIKED